MSDLEDLVGFFRALLGGRLVGNVGGIPGFLNVVLSSHDGRRQLGVMINVLAAPDAVVRAFIQGVRELGVRLLA